MSVRAAGKTTLYFNGEQTLNEAGNVITYDIQKGKHMSVLAKRRVVYIFQCSAWDRYESQMTQSEEQQVAS